MNSAIPSTTGTIQSQPLSTNPNPKHHHHHKRSWHTSLTIPTRKWPNPNPSITTTTTGSKMVLQLVGAFNQLSLRMSPSSSSESLLFDALKLSIPLLLSDLRMDAEVISASLLSHPFHANPDSLPLSMLRSRLGSGTAYLLHDSLRLSSSLSSMDDESAASDLRRFCLTFYDSRALALHIAFAFDAMVHHLPHLPRYKQQVLALRALRIYAPLAHALGLSLSLQLEDLSFRCLFPYSYRYLDAWLKTHAEPALLDSCKASLIAAIRSDERLSRLVSDFTVTGRYKSRYSTMKKLLKDGRKPEEVNDIVGLRVVLHPHSSDQENSACYAARDIVRRLWKEVSHRTKDYISNPKPNGYKSLHMAVIVNEHELLMEVQIRTAEMDTFAVAGAASHSFYKAGLTDPQQARRLKAIMVAASELAASRLRGVGSGERGDGVFGLLDKNGDGRISVEELKEVMEELGAPGEDARHMMHLLDSNSDGSLSSDEFESFQRRVEFMRSVEDADDHYKSVLDEKLQLGSGQN